jgi:hypothetical protein
VNHVDCVFFLLLLPFSSLISFIHGFHVHGKTISHARKRHSKDAPDR